MDVGETRSFSMVGSPRFIAAYQLEDYSEKVDVFLVDNPILETRGKAAEKPVVIKEKQEIPQDEFRDFIYYLNRGSSIDVTLTAENSGTMDAYIIQGQASFDSFKEAFETSSVIWSTYYRVYRTSSNNIPVKIHWAVKEDDVYFLVFVNEYHNTCSISHETTVQRTHYLLDKETPICGPNSKPDTEFNSDDSCYVPLSYWTEKAKTVILRAPRDDEDEGKTKGNVDKGDSADETGVGKVGREESSARSEITFEVESYAYPRYLAYFWFTFLLAILPVATLFGIRSYKEDTCHLANLQHTISSLTGGSGGNGSTSYSSVPSANSDILLTSAGVAASTAEPIALAEVITPMHGNESSPLDSILEANEGAAAATSVDAGLETFASKQGVPSAPQL